MRLSVLSLAVIGVCAVAAGCGSSPLAPAPPLSTASPPTPQPTIPGTLDGIWRGYLRATECTLFTCFVEKTTPFVVRITRAGSRYIGALELEEAGQMNLALDVTGDAEPDGSVLFTGLRAPLDSFDSANVDLKYLRVKTDPSSGLTGEIDLRKYYTGNGQNRSLKGRILSASYQPFVSLPSQSVSGSWSGRAIIRGCSGSYCRTSRDVDGTLAVSMVLNHTGSAAAGQLQLSLFSCSQCWLPVTGNVSASQISLSSDRMTRATPFNDRTLHLESFTGSLDSLGRITGRFVYASDTRIAVSPFDVFYRIECEILWLKRD